MVLPETVESEARSLTPVHDNNVAEHVAVNIDSFSRSLPPALQSTSARSLLVSDPQQRGHGSLHPLRSHSTGSALMSAQPGPDGVVGTAAAGVSNATPNPASTPLATPPTQARKVYRFKNNKWTTREIAALDFLLGIPLAAEERIVNEGVYMQKKQEQEMNSDEDDPTIKNSNEDTLSDMVAIPRNVIVSSVEARSKGRWWEKWINEHHHHPQQQQQQHALTSPARDSQQQTVDDTELERPEPAEGRANHNRNQAMVSTYVPGRRLEGDEAVRVQIPLTTKTLTTQRSIARQAALREWELQTAHGLKHTTQQQQSVNNNKNKTRLPQHQHQQTSHPPMLDGRLFFSASGSYPMSVFSLIRYEPKKEEMQQRRQKLEARGGGGTQFIMPARDWRGISYRTLLPRRAKHDSSGSIRAFNRFLQNSTIPTGAKGDGEKDMDGSGGGDDDDDDDSVSSDSSDDSDVYEPNLLDDPQMVLGRHRNVMIGDRVTGPMVSSTIQFVKPTLLKAELNKKFRERFDGWEPPKNARKYIGAKVVDGEYTLMDPTEDYHEVHTNMKGEKQQKRSRQGSVSSSSATSDAQNASVQQEKQLRIPPSLTLSKIRSLKQQALEAAVKAKLEISTVALACVYFERLCLDCRVDKSNRRLVFAACLLLASKLNEPNVGLVMRNDDKEPSDGMGSRLQSLVRPNKRSRNIFASLLEFFTEKWNLSLKHLFDAEWGVFAALGFSLHAKPSHVAFHFKRLMKQLQWNPRNYLAEKMYDQWQAALDNEEERRRDRELRHDRVRRRKEVKLLNLGIEMENERRKAEERGAKSSSPERESDHEDGEGGAPSATEPNDAEKDKSPRKSGMRLLNRFAMRRVGSQSRLYATTTTDQLGTGSEHQRSSSRSRRKGRLPISPSMPVLPSSETTLTASSGGGIPQWPESLDSAVVSVPSKHGVVAIDVPQNHKDGDETSSIGSFGHSEKGIVI